MKERKQTKPRVKPGVAALQDKSGASSSAPENSALKKEKAMDSFVSRVREIRSKRNDRRFLLYLVITMVFLEVLLYWSSWARSWAERIVVFFLSAAILVLALVGLVFFARYALGFVAEFFGKSPNRRKRNSRKR